MFPIGEIILYYIIILYILYFILLFYVIFIFYIGDYFMLYSCLSVGCSLQYKMIGPTGRSVAWSTGWWSFSSENSFVSILSDIKGGFSLQNPLYISISLIQSVRDHISESGKHTFR